MYLRRVPRQRPGQLGSADAGAELREPIFRRSAWNCSPSIAGAPKDSPLIDAVDIGQATFDSVSIMSHQGSGLRTAHDAPA
jgi:hypothetical protein